MILILKRTETNQLTAIGTFTIHGSQVTSGYGGRQLHFFEDRKFSAPGFTPHLEIQEGIQRDFLIHNGTIFQSNKSKITNLKKKPKQEF